MVWEGAVPETHLLRQLGATVPWEWFSDRLTEFYLDQAHIGRPPPDPAVIFKMLLLSYLYSLSEWQTEVSPNDSLSAKWLFGIGS